MMWQVYYHTKKKLDVCNRIPTFWDILGHNAFEFLGSVSFNHNYTKSLYIYIYKKTLRKYFTLCPNLQQLQSELSRSLSLEAC